MKSVSVIGIGNSIMGDDGVGIHAVLKLREMGLPAAVEIFDAGTDAFYAIEAMDGKDKAIILDACKGGKSSGTVYRFICDPIHEKWEPAFGLSMHGMNFMDIMITSEAFKLPPEIVLLGVEPEKIDWSTELSPKVKEALPLLIEMVIREL
ncbi:MAG: hydrogenase maturation protease [Euryarchaeota archaeon]|nr:hydrogenase maturation protease [Euryarchaeota archaeon]